MHEVGRVGLDLSYVNRDRAYRGYICRYVLGVWFVHRDGVTVAHGMADLDACAKAIDALWGE